MREKILTIIEKNSRLTVKDIASILGESEAKVAAEIEAMENEH
ncbi:MAG: AsnC family protein, partial [Oribacterium sp.]|nr:AsnC family protein [Oribacterium sp.]